MSKKCHMCGTHLNSSDSKLCSSCLDKYYEFTCIQCNTNFQCYGIDKSASLPNLCSDCNMNQMLKLFSPEIMKKLDSKVKKRRSNFAYEFLIGELGFKPGDAIEIVNHRRNDLGLLDIRDREI